MKKLLAVLLLTLPAIAQSTFTNPIRPSGPDPWIERDGSTYYLMTTSGDHLVIRSSMTLEGFKTAEPIIVWTPEATGLISKQIWAPELHHIDGKWYIYFSADDGKNANHRVYVLESTEASPRTQHWTLKGQLSIPADRWAIDLSVFQFEKKWYAIWSGWAGTENGTQSIYIAQMKNPWTLKGERVLISTPQHDWETIGDLKNPHDVPHINVNEGPEALVHDGRLFLTFSASACWTDHYALGLLSLAKGGNPLKPGDWSKSKYPVFQTNTASPAYSPGHNGFFTSPNGTENWIVYHANPEPNQGCGNHRSTRVQRFTWNMDGTPNFGDPVPLGKALAEPSGEKP